MHDGLYFRVGGAGSHQYIVSHTAVNLLTRDIIRYKSESVLKRFDVGSMNTRYARSRR